MTLWPYAAVTLAVCLLSLRLVLRRHFGLIGMVAAFGFMSMYYMQDPNDLPFIQTWGRPLVLTIYLSVFFYLLTVYIRERRK